MRISASWRFLVSDLLTPNFVNNMCTITISSVSFEKIFRYIVSLLLTVQKLSAASSSCGIEVSKKSTISLSFQHFQISLRELSLVAFLGPLQKL